MVTHTQLPRALIGLGEARITGDIWREDQRPDLLEDIVEKLADKHGVSQVEVREIFASAPHFRFTEKGHHRREDVYVALGQTQAGRYLAVYFIHKRDSKALILSARDMTRAERRLYEQR